MIDPVERQNPIDDGRIREQAAAWVARMERRSSPRLERQLDRWLAADPRHVVAYRRIGERFGGARLLRSSQRYAGRELSRRSRVRPVAATTAAVAACAAAFVLLLPRHDTSPLGGGDRQEVANSVPITRPAVADQRLAATTGAARSIGLQDGSVVTLDGGSVVDVAFTSGARRLTLVRGRARFAVAKEGRPFTVAAGGGAIAANGAEFDVSLEAAGLVRVALLRGMGDVSPQAARPGVSHVVRRVLAGKNIGYASGALVVTSPGLATSVLWADRAVEFDDVSLGYIVDRANRGAGASIRLVDPALAGLRVSGRFETGDRDRLAQNLARLFDLRVDRGDGAIVLRRN